MKVRVYAQIQEGKMKLFASPTKNATFYSLEVPDWLIGHILTGLEIQKDEDQAKLINESYLGGQLDNNELQDAVNYYEFANHTDLMEVLQAFVEAKRKRSL